MINSKENILVYDNKSRGDTYTVTEIVYEDDTTIMAKLDDSYDETPFILIDKITEEVLTKTLESYYAKNYNTDVNVPREVMDNLYRIMAGISGDFSSAEVSDSVKHNMTHAHRFILNYGKENKINLREE